jgi:hypothetical protein
MKTIKQLIEDYKRRLQTTTELLETSNNSESISDIKKIARLNAKAGEYRTIISELEQIEGASLPSLTKERIIAELQNPYPESVFTSILDENIDAVVKLLKDNGYSSDALFGWWGRQVWNNCVDKVLSVIDALTESEPEIKEQLCENCKYSCLLKDNKPCNACNSGEHWQSVEPELGSKQANAANNLPEKGVQTSSFGQAWECPRCHKIHAFYVSDCDCPPKVYTSATHDSVQSVEPDKTAEEGDEIIKARIAGGIYLTFHKELNLSLFDCDRIVEFVNQFKIK